MGRDQIIFKELSIDPVVTDVTKPEIRHKALTKLQEIDVELDRAGGVVQELRHLLLMQSNLDLKVLSQSESALRGWIVSLCESITYVSTMLSGPFGAQRCIQLADPAMLLGYTRAMRDLRIMGVENKEVIIDQLY